jgi:hypothetical protein
VTCIVGLEYGGRAYLGSDASCLAGWSVTTVHTPKVFRVGSHVIGVAGSPRLHDVMRLDFAPPEPNYRSPERLWRHMVTAFVPVLREQLAEAGHSRSAEGMESMGESGFLVAVGGCVFLVDSDFQVGRGYNAIGASCDVALGALWMLMKAAAWPNTESAVTMVLEAAAHHCAGVRPPFAVLATEP